jgi:hypothetical protein
MIIFGSTSLNSTIGSGDFFCPRCNMQRPYRHIGVNRFFTLYFIPLIPMGRAGDYVECQQCTGTYGAEVLNYRPESAGNLGSSATKFWTDLRRCLIVLLHNAQRTDPQTLSLLKSWYEHQAQDAVSLDVIARELRQAAEAGAQVAGFAQQSLGGLGEDTKLSVLQAGRGLLERNGRLEEGEKAALRQLGAGLGIPAQLVETHLS